VTWKVEAEAEEDERWEPRKECPVMFMICFLEWRGGIDHRER